MNITTATGQNSSRLYLKIQMYAAKLIPSSGPLIVGAVNYIMAPLWLMNPNFLSLKSVADTHVDPTLLEAKLQEGHLTQTF